MNKNKLTRILAGIFILFTFTSCVYHAKKSQKLLATAAIQSYDLIVVPGIAYDSTGWTRIMKASILVEVFV
jgi:preprotein translocase subunit SecG